MASGLPLALAGGTLAFRLREAQVDLAAVGAFAAIASPYPLKLFWAPLVDRLRLPGLGRLGARRGWALLAEAGIAIAILGLAAIDPAASLGTTAALALALTISGATHDIAIDGLRIAWLEPEMQAAGAALAGMGYRLGLTLGGAGALALSEALGWGGGYAIMLAPVLLASTMVLSTPERIPDPTRRASERWDLPSDGPTPADSPSVRWDDAPRETGLRSWLRNAIVEPARDFMRGRAWGTILAFVLLYNLGNAFVGIMINPLYVDLGFSRLEVAGYAKTLGLGAVIAGAALGGWVTMRLGVLRGLMLASLAQLGANLLYARLAVAGHETGWLAAVVTIDNLSHGVTGVAFGTYLARLCSPAFAATQFALLSSAAVLGRDWVAAAFAGTLAKALGYPSYFVLATAFGLPGLVLLAVLARRELRAAAA